MKLEDDPDVQSGDEGDDCLFYVFKQYYAPFVLSDFIRVLVMFLFFAWACFCIALIPKVQVGLDQQLSMPRVGVNESWWSTCTCIFCTLPNLVLLQ